MTEVFNGIKDWSTFPIVTVNNFINFQTYENNKVTFLYNQSTLAFDTIANFNANIGDKWLDIHFPDGNSNATCYNNTVLPRKSVTVIDTGHVLVNNLPLKKITVTYQLGFGSYTGTLTMVEKISGINGFLFPFAHCIIDGPSYGNFVCYSDNNFPV